MRMGSLDKAVRTAARTGGEEALAGEAEDFDADPDEQDEKFGVTRGFWAKKGWLGP